MTNWRNNKRWKLVTISRSAYWHYILVDYLFCTSGDDTPFGHPLINKINGVHASRTINELLNSETIESCPSGSGHSRWICKLSGEFAAVGSVS